MESLCANSTSAKTFRRVVCEDEARRRDDFVSLPLEYYYLTGQKRKEAEENAKRQRIVDRILSQVHISHGQSNSGNNSYRIVTFESIMYGR